MRISDWSSDVCSSDLMDPEVGAALQSYLEAEGVRVCSGIGYQRIDPTGNGIELICESLSCDGEGHCDTVAAVRTIAAEQVLIATGRRPNSDGMGLEDHGIALGQSGRIVVDDCLEPSVPGIYAAGQGRVERRERGCGGPE